MMFEVQPITLTGKLVRLEPLSLDHVGELFEAAQDPDIWTYMSADPSRSVADMQVWIAAALHKQQVGSELPFAICDLARGYLCGSTRYLDIVPHDRGLEIGSTWLGVSARRTGINTECKYLLLKLEGRKYFPNRKRCGKESSKTVGESRVGCIGAGRSEWESECEGRVRQVQGIERDRRAWRADPGENTPLPGSKEPSNLPLRLRRVRAGAGGWWCGRAAAS